MVKIIYLMLVLCLLPLINAEQQTLGTFEKNKEVTLIQTCLNSSYSNITRVIYPNSTLALNGQYSMTKTGYNYNYTFNNNILLGRYLVYGICDESSTLTGWQYDYYITSTGDKVSLSNIILVLVFLASSAILYFIGNSFDKGNWVIKSSLYLVSILLLLLGLNSSRIIASESLGLGLMANSGLIILISMIIFIFLYIFIVWTIETFKSVKQKEGVRWQY
jgi:hypothetical protein